MVAAFGESGAASVDYVGRSGLVVVCVGLRGDHRGLPVAADNDCVWEKLTVLVQLLLGEAECGLQESIEIMLRLR